MRQEPPEYENDPGRWGASLRSVREILLACLDARGARSVVEVGAYAGDLTQELLSWATDKGARVVAIDPTPQDQLLALEEERPELELIRKTSHDALRQIPGPDAVIIDGDHNYYTVSEELRLIGEAAPGTELPLLMLHDVCWPHARRDTYYAPERIPEEKRQPMARDGELAPENPGLTKGGLRLPWVAEREGGPRNGVLTAVEDFVGFHEGLHLAILPLFFGFGVVWHEDAPSASAIAEIVEPWDRNPLLARLEDNRVYHLASEHQFYVEARDLKERLAQLEHRLTGQEALLRSMLSSRAFALGERLSRLRQRERPIFSRAQVRQVLGEDGRR